jgi:hypothetical protein
MGLPQHQRWRPSHTGRGQSTRPWGSLAGGVRGVCRLGMGRPCQLSGALTVSVEQTERQASTHTPLEQLGVDRAAEVFVHVAAQGLEDVAEELGGDRPGRGLCPASHPASQRTVTTSPLTPSIVSHVACVCIIHVIHIITGVYHAYDMYHVYDMT